MTLIVRGTSVTNGGRQIQGKHFQGGTGVGNKKSNGMERKKYLKGKKRGINQDGGTSNPNLFHEHVQNLK